ncbi:MAG: hypothetical protein NC541_08720 [bacterium]|nr:hypothetical protein [bacterium]
MAVVETLEVDIQGKSESVNKSLDDLVKRLGLIAEGLIVIGKNSGLEEFAKKAQEITKNLGSFQNAAKGISASMEPQIQKAAKSLEELTAKFKDLGKGFTFKGSTDEIKKQIDKYTNSLETARLKKEELEAAGKTGGKMYEAAIADTVKCTNIIGSLKQQLVELQTVQPQLNIDLSNFEKAEKAVSSMSGALREAVSISESAMNYNPEAMAATFGEAARNIENYQQAVEQLGTRAGQILNDSTQLNINISGLEEAEQNISGLSGQLQNMKDLFLQTFADLKSGDIFRYLSESAQDFVKRAQSAFSGLTSTMPKLASGIKGVASKFSNMAKAFTGLKDASKGMDTSLQGGFKTFLKYAFGIRSFCVLMNKLRAAMKEGFKNLAQYSSKTNTSISMLQSSLGALKNSLATAFAPILNVIAPALSAFIDMLTKAFNTVGQFFSALTGKSFAVQAKKTFTDYADSISEAGSATKDAGKDVQKGLRAFDELNVIYTNNKEKSGNGGEVTPADMFETVPIDNGILDFVQRIKDLLKPVIGYAQKLKDVFAQGFMNGLGDWEYRWESIKKSIASTKESLIDIWADPAVLSAADGWAQSVAYMLGGLAGSTASIGLTIGTNAIGGIAKYLEENKERIKEYLISMFDIRSEINLLFSELFQSIAYVFEAFASGDGQQLTSNIIGIFANAFMGAAELVSKSTRDILNIFIQPFVDNKEEFRTALDGYLGVLAEVTGTIKNGIDETFNRFNEVYDEHFKPFFDSITSGLSDTVGSFMEFWNGSVQPILDEWAAKFDEVWGAHIQPTFNKFSEVLGKIADLLKAVWENVLKPVMGWIVENVLPVLLPIFKGIGDAALSLFGTIGDVVGHIIDAFGGIIDFLTGIFTGNWEKAWEGIVGTFKGIFNTIVDVVEGVINGAINIINGLIGGINKITVNIGIPSIPDIPEVSIPGLEKGGITLKHTIAEIGEYNKPEAVLPLTNTKTMGMIADSIISNIDYNTAQNPGRYSEEAELLRSQNQLIRRQNELLQAILNKPTMEIGELGNRLANDSWIHGGNTNTGGIRLAVAAEIYG